MNAGHGEPINKPNEWEKDWKRGCLPLLQDTTVQDMPHLIDNEDVMYTFAEAVQTKGIVHTIRDSVWYITVRIS